MRERLTLELVEPKLYLPIQLPDQAIQLTKIYLKLFIFSSLYLTRTRTTLCSFTDQHCGIGARRLRSCALQVSNLHCLSILCPSFNLNILPLLWKCGDHICLTKATTVEPNSSPLNGNLCKGEEKDLYHRSCKLFSFIRFD